MTTQDILAVTPPRTETADIAALRAQSFRRTKASEFLTQNGYQTAASTLAKLASIGGGPRFRRFGKMVLYDPADLLAWAEARTTRRVHSTSELAPKRVGPGRPPKAAPTDEVPPAAALSAAAPAGSAPKRKPGRPRKTPGAPAPQTQRRRGRSKIASDQATAP